MQVNTILKGCTMSIYSAVMRHMDSVFCSKVPYLVGHSLYFNGSSDKRSDALLLIKKKKKWCCVLISKAASVIRRESSGS